VRTCVIFNPVARGGKARRLRRHLDDLGKEATLKLTTAAGDARRLAAEAVAEGFEIIVAAGGDGTLNEVLNGIGDAPDGFERARLGVLPLGTVNVYAREYALSTRLDAAWAVIRQGREMRIDLPAVDYSVKGAPQRHYFAQMSGAGLDARAIELVDWQLKKKLGPLAYVVAGFQALAERQPRLQARANGEMIEGELALLGNGKFYGGPFEVFPGASLDDGLLDVCVFPRVALPSLLRLAPGFLLRRRFSEHRVRRLQGSRIEVTSDQPVAIELDGEWVGHLPATFSLEPKQLRVVVP